MLAVSMTHP